MTTKVSKNQAFQVIKFTLFSISAGIIQVGSFALLELFIGSGTAKAFLIMPLVAPLSDLVGITRQSVVTTFCIADGFTNLLYPTNGLMIIAIGLVSVSYSKWIKWSWKLFVAEFGFSAAIMALMVYIGY